MTLERKFVRSKTGQAQNAGTSQAVPLKAGDNLFDGAFLVEPSGAGYVLRWGNAYRWKYYGSLDDLMTFLADQAIEKIGRVEQ